MRCIDYALFNGLYSSRIIMGFLLLLLVLWTAVEGQAVERCANDTSILAVKPCLLIAYATDEKFCIEPTTQEGTVVAVLYCVLDQPGGAVLTGHTRRAYRSHSAQNGSTIVFYLTTTGNRSQTAPARDRIALTCETSSAHSNQVALNVSYCPDANQSGAPYLLGIPPSTTVRVNVGQRTDIALFNVIAKSLWTKSGVSISIDTLHTVEDCLPMEQNDSATCVTHQVPFYVGDGNVVFLNGTQSVGSDEIATYSLVVAASDSETGAVTLVHSSVKMIKTLGAAAGTEVCQHLPSVTVNTTASCVTILSQPGQLLATVQCSHLNHITKSNQTVVVSLSPVTTIARRRFQDRPRPTNDVFLEAQRDHNNAEIFYILIHRVSLTIPNDVRMTPPKYMVHVHCSNGVSMATRQQPVKFCVKHNNLKARYNTQSQQFSVETDTPYFTNVPHTYHVLYDRHSTRNFDGILFNMEVLTHKTTVMDRNLRNSINITDTMITAEDIMNSFTLWPLSFVNHPFRTGYTVVSREPGLTAVDVNLYFTSAAARRERYEVQSVYDLVLLVRPKKQHVGSAAVKVTIVVQQSTNPPLEGLFNLDLVRSVAEVNLSVRATKGTLIAASTCTGGSGSSDVTVTRTNALFRGADLDSADLVVVRGQGASNSYYLVVEDIHVEGRQYFLLNCTDGVSSFTKRITVITSGDRSNDSSPFFSKIEKPPYVRTVNLSGNDTQIVQLGASMIKGTILSRRVDTNTSNVPFYIGEDFVLMLNNSEARRRAVTLPSSFDVVLNVVGTRTSQGASSQPTPNDNGYFHAVVELLDGTAASTGLLVTPPTNTPSNTTTAPSNQNNTVGIAVGVTVAVVIVAALAVAAVVAGCIVRRLRRPHKTVRSLSLARYDAANLISPNNYDIIHLNLIDEWTVDWSSITLGRKLGEGEFSTVHRGLIAYESIPQPRQEHFTGMSVVPVAIKVLKGRLSTAELKAFYDEIELSKKVSVDINPHVVKLIGCVTNRSPMAILLEYAAHGDLLHYLRAMGKTERSASTVELLSALGGEDPDDEQEQGLESGDLMSFAQQIASGMEFLAALSVVHRDLACRNVLVADRKVLKISDFGLSKNTDLYVSSLSGKLPIRWMAPESIRERVFTEKSDVWSYGITLWEICTLGAIPYPDLSNQEVVTKVIAGYRMKKPINCSEKIFNIMTNCWQQRPKDRLTFAVIHQTLRNYMQRQNISSYIRMSEVESYPMDFEEEETTIGGRDAVEMCNVPEEVFT